MNLCYLRKVLLNRFILRNFNIYIFGLFLIQTFLMSTFTFAAPITFNTALPVAKGEGIFRIQTKYIQSTDDPSTLDRELTVWAFPVVGVYGITEKLAVFGIVPVLDKNLDVDTPMGRKTRSVSGPGDVTFIARYTVWKQDRPGQTFRIAPFVSIETPTGEDDEEDSLGRLPRTLQLGSGSWDPSLGIVITRQTLDRQIDASVSYKLNTEANDFEFGDVARLDISYQHRIWPKKLEFGVPAFVYAVLESSLICQDKNRLNGMDDSNSGGTTWYLTPGIQYVTRRIVAEVAAQLPVVQDLNGTALENDFTAILSFRVNF